MKISLKWIFFIIGIMGIILSLLIALFLILGVFNPGFYIEPALSINNTSYFQNTSIKIIQKESTDSNLPVRLYIPKLRINIALEHIGLTPQGAMDVPKGRNNAGWYNLGPRPGEKGSAVIDGHYGVWKGGKTAVFNNLHRLQKGDKVFIKNKNGETITFIVRSSRIFGQDEDASNVFISNDGKSHLNIITCQGVWDKVKKNYLNRLVVFTDKE